MEALAISFLLIAVRFALGAIFLPAVAVVSVIPGKERIR